MTAPAPGVRLSLDLDDPQAIPYVALADLRDYLRGLVDRLARVAHP